MAVVDTYNDQCDQEHIRAEGLRRLYAPGVIHVSLVYNNHNTQHYYNTDMYFVCVLICPLL